MKRHRDVTAHVFIAFVTVVVIAVIGWVMNIYSLVTAVGETTGLTVVRAIGIFVAPLGAVLGYF